MIEPRRVDGHLLVAQDGEHYTARGWGPWDWEQRCFLRMALGSIVPTKETKGEMELFIRQCGAADVELVPVPTAQAPPPTVEELRDEQIAGQLRDGMAREAAAVRHGLSVSHINYIYRTRIGPARRGRPRRA